MQDADYDVFISHASANKRWVEVLARNLARQGLQVFYDEWCLKPGAALVDGLYEGLKRSRAGILVVSPEAANSGWVSREYGHMLNRQANHREFVIVPVVYGELVEFPFLRDILWVDFREPNDYRKAFHRLLCGLRKEKPGMEQRFEGELKIPGGEAKTPLEVHAQDFFNNVFANLNSSAPILLLLAQAYRVGGPVIPTLLERAHERFGESNTLRLMPPIDPRANTTDYFKVLAQQCGFDKKVANSVGFENALRRRLSSGEPLFLLISGFENGARDGRGHLASMLRNFKEIFPTLRVVICGGKRLNELKYAEGDLSMFRGAKDLEWPELAVADVHRLYEQSFPGDTLSSDDEAKLLLQISGGHPGLLDHCFECRKKDKALDEQGYRGKLIKSSIAYQTFTPFKQNPQTAARICDWLRKDDLGEAEPFIHDNLLRQLYWENLLCKSFAGNARERLRWRCMALREAGRAILRCSQ